jgi:transposase-like protein
MRERGGRVVASPIEATDSDVIHDEIRQHVEAGARVHTDEFAAYRGLDGFTHETVNHGASEFVRGDVTTNGIESVFAVLKRGIYGTYHHVTPKHLARYVDEFAFRLNEGNVKRHTLARLDSFTDGVTGKRLTYKDLIG